MTATSVPADHARLITSNLVEAMKFFGRAQPMAEVRDSGALTTVYSGLNYGAFNAGLFGRPVEAGEAERSITSAADYFTALNRRWSFWYCDDHLDKLARKRAKGVLHSRGLSFLSDHAGMLAEALRPPSRALPEITVARVDGAPARLTFAHITSIAFEIPGDICRDIYGSERAWQGSFTGYIGLAGAAPVSTMAVVETENAAGIYSVGTLPGFRGRGYAEALMRVVLGRLREKRGMVRTLLQSTRSGHKLYERMGYRRVTSYSVYITE